MAAIEQQQVPNFGLERLPRAGLTLKACGLHTNIADVVLV
jgi:hypothetical protein